MRVAPVTEHLARGFTTASPGDVYADYAQRSWHMAASFVKVLEESEPFVYCGYLAHSVGSSDVRIKKI